MREREGRERGSEEERRETGERVRYRERGGGERERERARGRREEREKREERGEEREGEERERETWRERGERSLKGKIRNKVEKHSIKTLIHFLYTSTQEKAHRSVQRRQQWIGLQRIVASAPKATVRLHMMVNIFKKFRVARMYRQFGSK